jgi:pimeloyl-ACP methyl ester carboxylesterase
VHDDAWDLEDRSPRYRSRARGAILLLHGQPGWGAMWRPIADALRRRLAPLAPELIAPDRPGWGRSPLDVRGIADNADAAARELDRHGVERAVVVGHSFGGAVALALAARHPSRVASLALLAPAAHRAALNRVDRVLARPLVGDAAAFVGIGAAEELVRRPALRRLVASYGKGALPSSMGLIAPALGARRHWRSFAVEQRALIGEVPTLEAALPSVAAPALALSGGDDHAVPPAAVAGVVEGLADAELVELPGAGHQLPLEAVDACAAAIGVAWARAHAR